MENRNSRHRGPFKGPNNVSRREATSDSGFRYSLLMKHILEDVRSAYEPPEKGLWLFLNEYERDCEEIRNRIRSEGLSFLTKTLPSLGKAIDMALATDSPLAVSGFELRPDSKIPKLFGVLLQKIFVDGSKSGVTSDVLADLEGKTNPSEDGLPIFHLTLKPFYTSSKTGDHSLCGLGRRGNSTVTEQQSSHALACLRQICYSFYKLELPYDEKVSDKVIADFVRCDMELPEEIRGLSSSHTSIMRVARHLVCRVLANCDPLGITPKHGPGAVATGEGPTDKAVFKRFYRRLATVYNYDQYFFYNQSHLCDRLQELQALEDLEYGTAKVVLVPKDSRGPRLISCEPLENQWIQQGQMQLLVDCIETHWLTKGRVNFTHQTVNQRLALDGSSPRKGENALVTLDMKEASDRVSLALVKALFPERWYEALYASRSEATKLPDGQVVRLKKFAPMGSAVCFPVEALIFWALGVALTLCKHHHGKIAKRAFKRGNPFDLLQLNQKFFPEEDPLAFLGGVQQLAGSDPRQWYVYGDDIICAGENVPEYRQLIEAVNLKLNDSKCCVAGFFRESCGVDAYLGVNVTPTKFRRTWSHRLQSESYPSWVAYSNLLWDKGFYSAAEYIFECIQKVHPTPTVMCGDDVDGIVFKRPYVDKFIRYQYRSVFKRRFNRRLQRMEIQLMKSRPTLAKGDNPGWEELLRVTAAKRLTVLDSGDNEDSASLDALPDPLVIEADWYALPRRNKLKRGWMALT